MKKLILTIMTLVGAIAANAQCHPSFTDTVQSGRTVRFTNKTVFTTGPMQYVYFTLDFGDGTSTSSLCCTGTSVTHTYSGTGTAYYLMMHMYRYDSSTTPTTLCSDTATGYLTFTAASNSINGTIIDDTSSSTVNAALMVYLIKYDSAANTLTAVDSTMDSMYNHTATYNFNSEPAGNYRVKAAVIGGPTSGTGAVPTYGYSNTNWAGASVIHHSGASTEVIHMQNGMLTSGPGFIGGNVGSGANKGTGSYGTPVANVLVFLKNSADEIVAYTYTNMSGDYSFSNLPYAAYTVYPEVMNFATTPQTNISINSTTPSNTAVSFGEHTVSKTITPHTVGVAVLSLNDQVAVYPNPSKGIVNINLPEAATVTVTDIIGHKALLANTNAGTNALNLSDLGAGIYFISVKSDNINYTSKVVLQK